MSIELVGNWRKGFAYDLHTLSSNYLGVDEEGYKHWDTVLEKNIGSTELKNIEEKEERLVLLRKHMRFKNTVEIEGKNILLIDDLYRSG